MKLVALNVPDDPAALPGWLDRQVAGLDLGALAAELDAVHGPAAGPATTLERLLGDRRDAVLARGLSVLAPATIRQFLRRPGLLLDLQAMVLVEGGPYWRQLGPPEADHVQVLARSRQRLGTVMSAPTDPPRTPRVAWPGRPWVVALATAASVLIAARVYEQTRAPLKVTAAPTGWGWNQSDALPRDLPPAAYLNRLADAADEWFAKRPDTPAALAQRIGEFRQGCSVVILAEHPPLSADDKKWLVEKCRAWAVKLDTHLVDVEAGRGPLQVRAEADATIKKLIAALRERAKARA